jgi:hypothetical protein
MTLQMGMLEDILGHFKRVPTKILSMGMMNDENETA